MELINRFFFEDHQPRQCLSTSSGVFFGILCCIISLLDGVFVDRMNCCLPRPVLVTEAGGDAYLAEWSYDGLGRLAGETMSSGTPGGGFNFAETYRHDLLGNRQRVVRAEGGLATTTTSVYDRLDRVRTSTSDAGMAGRGLGGGLRCQSDERRLPRQQRDHQAGPRSRGGDAALPAGAVG
jgi:YD repeat-containing protein